jgi:hypothetical protein
VLNLLASSASSAYLCILRLNGPKQTPHPTCADTRKNATFMYIAFYPACQWGQQHMYFHLQLIGK